MAGWLDDVLGFIGGHIPELGGLALGGIGTYLGYKGTKKAADISSEAAYREWEAAEKARKTALEMYYQSREDVLPWMEAGEYGLGELMRYMQDPSLVTEMPGYEFGLGEGINALARGASARGRQLSGAQGKALQRFGQDYAQQNFLNYLKPYQSLAGLGQTSAMGMGGLTGQAAGQIIPAIYAGGQALGSAGQAQAAGVLGGGNTLAQLMGWGAGQLMDYGMMRRIGGPGGGARPPVAPGWEYQDWSF
jgi:hypothetical protein